MQTHYRANAHSTETLSSHNVKSRLHGLCNLTAVHFSTAPCLKLPRLHFRAASATTQHHPQVLQAEIASLWHWMKTHFTRTSPLIVLTTRIARPVTYPWLTGPHKCIKIWLICRSAWLHPDTCTIDITPIRPIISNSRLTIVRCVHDIVKRHARVNDTEACGVEIAQIALLVATFVIEVVAGVFASERFWWR